jgi:hypothetical protein
MDVKAGRKKSGGPAGVFKQGISPTHMMGLNGLITVSPKELNFVVYGTMHFNING